jgi:hypothetical protein
MTELNGTAVSSACKNRLPLSPLIEINKIIKFNDYFADIKCCLLLPLLSISYHNDYKFGAIEFE